MLLLGGAAGSMLSFGHVDDKAIQSVSQRDLACEPRVRARLRHQVEHLLFHRGTYSCAIGPLRINIDMTGGTGAITAAIPVDSRHPVVCGRSHQRGARGHFYRVCAASEVDKCNFEHAKPSRYRVEISHWPGLERSVPTALCGAPSNTGNRLHIPV